MPMGIYTINADDFDTALSRAVLSLKNDHVSGARQLADKALLILGEIIPMAILGQDEDGIWNLSVSIAQRRLCTARPSMNAAITSCLLRAIQVLRKSWEETPYEDLSAYYRNTIASIYEERLKLGSQLGGVFVDYLHRKHPSNKHIRILTLSNSSTIRSAIMHALTHTTDLSFHITIMESRPHCEGAAMAATLLSSLPENVSERLRIHIIPDCAVATFASDIKIVLLGADRISATGDVSNKIGSYASAICAKHENSGAEVLVLSDVDKIAPLRDEEKYVERHESCEMTAVWKEDVRSVVEEAGVEVCGVWFEWVPSTMVDAYITEQGVLSVEEVEKKAKEIEELEKDIFR